MSTVKLLVPRSLYREVFDTMKKNGVRYYPIRKGMIGYTFEMERGHMIVPFLILKYDLEQVD